MNERIALQVERDGVLVHAAEFEPQAMSEQLKKWADIVVEFARWNESAGETMADTILSLSDPLSWLEFGRIVISHDMIENYATTDRRGVPNTHYRSLVEAYELIERIYHGNRRTFHGERVVEYVDRTYRTGKRW